MESRRRIPRGAALMTFVITVGAMIACNETPFAHTNPYDPANPFTYTMTGSPDTTYSIGDQVTLQLHFPGSIPFVPQNAGWESSDSATLRPFLLGAGPGEGFFAVERASLVGQTVTLAGGLALRRFEHVVYVRQRVTYLNAACSGVCLDTARAFNQSWDVRFDAHDARIRAVTDVVALADSASATVRAPGGVQVLPRADGVSTRRVLAKGNGETWVVFSLHGGVDSMKFVVKQTLLLDVSCPSTVKVGQSVQIPAPFGVDPNGNPFQGTLPTVSWSSGYDGYPDTPWAGAVATVTPGGLVTGVTPGLAWVTEGTRSDVGTILKACAIEVTP